MRIQTVDELGLPPVLKTIAEEERGLVLVTGTTGCGKSTTLAAMIDHINRTRAAHVMTVEDPVEFLHRDDKSIVNQREVSVDTSSFAHALRSALRQDPDVILVGEMRDFETIEIGLLAAETGHLVFSTLHTLDATETINRIIVVFPPHQQKQIRLQLASVLKAVVSQRLMPRLDGRGRVPAVEVMITTPFIRDCIVDKDKTHLIAEAIAAGTSQYGMQTFDQSIFGLFEQGLVSYDEALRWASNVDEFKLKVQGISTTSDLSRDQMARVGRRARLKSRDSEGDSETRRGPGFGHGKSRRTHHGREGPVETIMANAYIDALRMLARRELSEAQVRQRLARREHAPADIDSAVARLLAERAIDDARVAAAIARSQSAVKRRGRLRILRQIEQAGIARATARRATDEVFESIDPEALIEASLAKRLRGRARIGDQAEFGRLYRYLIGQGFGPDEVMRVLRARS